MKYIIVDDEKIARLSLKKMCERIPTLTLEKMYENAVDLVGDLPNLDVDLVFLDIHLPDLNGIEFLKTMDQLPQIIITSSDTKYAIDAFEYNVTDYLIKPVDFSRLMKAVNKAIRLTENSKVVKGKEESNQLFFKTNGRIVRVEKEDIKWIQVKGDYLIIQVENRKGAYVVHSTLKAIQNTLPENTFIKVHRSFIINLKKIKDIEGNTVVVGDKVITIARSMRNNLMDRIDLY